MRADKLITIVGGGLAGLSLGIGLRQLDVPVKILEAGRYPRHRVCGEFLSGRGLRLLGNLGVLDSCAAAGSLAAGTIAMGGRHALSAPVALPERALTLSRFTLDHLLAARFRSLGGDLCEGTRFAGDLGDGMVRASGRTPHTRSAGWRWIGLKAHARNVELCADLEMHRTSSGYVGLCRVEGGRVNVCALLRCRAAMPDLGARWQVLLQGEVNSPLHHRLRDADFDTDSFCTVAGLSLGRRGAPASGECRVGDAVTMIPPVTGNGMSMALESAEMAMPLLVDYSRGEVVWDETRRRISWACDQRFRRRLWWGGWIHHLLLGSFSGPLIGWGSARLPGLFRLLFHATR